jgi:hypothetical protein
LRANPGLHCKQVAASWQLTQFDKGQAEHTPTVNIIPGLQRVQLLASVSHSMQLESQGRQESVDKKVPGKQEVQAVASEVEHVLQEPLHLLQLEDMASSANPSAHSSHVFAVKQLEHPTGHM